MKRVVLVLLALGALLPLRTVGAEEFLVILDHSGSMGDASEMEPAKEALRQAMAAMETPGARWGLRVYGTGCCEPDTELVVPVSADGRAQIAQRLPGISGLAGSPMPAALRAAREEDFAGEGRWLTRRHVLVVSDGEIERDEACREARLLREDGVRVTILGLEMPWTPEGGETLRHIATHPQCAAGHYIRVDRPDRLAEAVERWSRAVLTFPFRMLALLLAALAGYYTTKCLEYHLERMTEWPRHFIPHVCNSVFALWLAFGLHLYLGLPPWLWLTLGLLPGVVTFFLRRSAAQSTPRGAR